MGQFKKICFVSKEALKQEGSKISENETFMFISVDDIHIEIKQSSDFIKNELKTYKGFCLPCLRMKGAFEHLKNINELTITSKIKNLLDSVISLKITKGLIGI